jgi:hypothetical protein
VSATYLAIKPIPRQVRNSLSQIKVPNPQPLPQLPHQACFLLVIQLGRLRHYSGEAPVPVLVPMPPVPPSVVINQQQASVVSVQSQPVKTHLQEQTRITRVSS